MPHDNPIDEAALDQLGTLKPGEDFARKIVRLYLDTTPSVLKEIESAASAQDMNWLNMTNHRMTSASAAIGAVRLTGRCNELAHPIRDARDQGGVCRLRSPSPAASVSPRGWSMDGC